MGLFMSEELRVAAEWIHANNPAVQSMERKLADAWLAGHSDAEKAAVRLRAENIAGDGKPVGTLEELLVCARMLDSYAAELFPAEENGQVHFARAIMESVADEIRAFNANQAKV